MVDGEMAESLEMELRVREKTQIAVMTVIQDRPPLNTILASLNCKIGRQHQKCFDFLLQNIFTCFNHLFTLLFSDALIADCTDHRDGQTD